jgi:hypothetical protein
MPGVMEVFRDKSHLAYFAAGAVWILVAVDAGGYVVLWPVVALLLGGLLLMLRPGARLTWAWAEAAAVLGLLVAGYQAYVASGLLSGQFAAVAVPSFFAFLAFAVVHLLLLLGRGAYPQAPR